MSGKEKVSVPFSEALTFVHYQIEQGDLDAAKAILRTMIRQLHAAEQVDKEMTEDSNELN